MKETELHHDKDIRDDLAWSQINSDILKSLENPRRGYWYTVIGCLVLLAIGITAAVLQYQYGLGMAKNHPHMWNLYIATFIFWIGMSHSGTLLSAILHIVHADWRKPIYRFAEAMTTFSLMTALLFPVIHLGRLWNFYWVIPYIPARGTWPNFRSPLSWDGFAIMTYLTSSALFLYIGMLPDLAIARDNTTGWRKKLYSTLSLGWYGSDRQWRIFRKAYMLMAIFLIPLAVSVHSIVSSDFAMSIMPGWHVTTFPPYFVSGALYSGCAAIITLFILLRYYFRWEEYMTLAILEKICKLTFAIAMVWTYLNLVEFSSVWYGHDIYAKEVLWAKMTGAYAPAFWSMMFFGSVLPFTLAFRKLRRHIPIMMAVSILLNVGMWLERWMIVSPTLSQSFYPWSWDVMWPTLTSWGIVLGSFGWFGLLFLTFVKIFPSVSMYEVKEMVYHRKLAREKGAVHGAVQGHAGGAQPASSPSMRKEGGP
jgi:molybdopterin-containing oxidoreductase family membrane subunit